MILRTLRALLAKGMMEIILLTLCVYLALAAPNFLTAGNFFNVLRSVSMLGLVAFGMTMVIIAGEIDLSVGSAVAFAACLIAWLTKAHVPIALGFVLTLGAGILLSSFTGLMRVKFQVPTFITTLALLTALRGAALTITQGFPITPFPQWYSFLGGGYVMGIPFPSIVFILTFIAVHFLMNHTSFGRAVYAVGGNAEAARLCGINVALVRVGVLAITGMLVAISGIMYSARIMSGTPSIGQGMELEAIAAVIIGGTSFTGGVGTIWGTLIGVIFIGVIGNGMTLLNVPSYTQLIVQGALILAAVLMNQLQGNRK
jgi:sugar transport system permease protein